MLTNELVEKVDNFYTNVKSFITLYLMLKDLKIEKQSAEDCFNYYNISNQVLESAAFMPDVLKILAAHIDEAVWLDESQKTEQVNKLTLCAKLLAKDRPSPMYEVLTGIRGDILNRLVKIQEESDEIYSCVNMFNMTTLH